MNKTYFQDRSFQIAGAASLVLHVSVFILTIIAFPQIAKEPISPPPPIQVEFISAQNTNTQKPEPQQKEQKKSAPKMTSDAPPDLSKTKPAAAPEANDNQDIPPPPSEMPEEKKIEQEKPKPEAIKPPPKVPRKPKPPELPKQDKKPDEKPKEEQNSDDAFSSLLKNLTPDADEAAPLTSPTDEEKSPAEQMANKISMSEEDALRAQLAKCWNVMAGAKMAEDLVVRVLVQMNPDRTVYQASILDKSRYNSDSYFRAAADSALRALRNPTCSPLELPPEKFDQWKSLIIRFDPRDML